MKNDIVEKLSLEFKKPIVDESQVIYILSRIRKILETDKDKNGSKYQRLKFYCDWALHAEIEKATKVFRKELKQFIEGDFDAATPMLTYQVFEKEFLAFLKQYQIPADNYKALKNNIAFKKLLAKIYAETPLIVTLTKRVQIVTNEGAFSFVDDKHAKIEIGFQITPLDD